MKVLKMKIYQPGIVRIRREVVRGKRRLPAQPEERLPDFFGQLRDVLGIPRGIMGELTAPWATAVDLWPTRLTSAAARTI